MKISSINSSYINNIYNQKRINYQNTTISMQHTDSISFGIANSSGLKNLFAYDLPCMYSGIIMIDPRKFQRLSKSNIFSTQTKKAISALKIFSKSFRGIENKAFKLIKLGSNLWPKSDNLRAVMQNFAPFFERTLISKQKPILEKLDSYTDQLPEEYNIPYRDLINRTIDIIDKKPVVIPFSTTEFKYKLGKIKADVDKSGNNKSMKVMIKMLREAEKLASHTNNDTLENQKNVVTFLNIILKTSVLKNHEQLKELLSTSQDRLNNKPAIVQFSRKSFIYDIMRTIDGIPNQTLKMQIFEAVKRLPTSSDNFAAYIVKISKESSDKIAYRLCWPYFASIEHIHPRSCGGKDIIGNFGGACARENSIRQNINFTEQLKRKPQTAKYCQQYIDRLLVLKKQGVFKKAKIYDTYIEDFAKAIQKESHNQVILRTAEPWYIKIKNIICLHYTSS